MGYVPDGLVGEVIGSAIEVHRRLGPGLLESAYQKCLAYELTIRRVPVCEQVRLAVTYRGLPLDCGYRLDFVVDRRLIVEVKAVEALLPIHTAQVLTYLKLLPASRGLLINFNVAKLVDGVKSLVL